ncbi:putative oocyte-secreted protein 1 homolog isoform X1 [Talpa occidentalis]|uniref:putative oocyte-secreted protein 1 homolog isoform X1 n=1 Tax=Talpa occidentalis TaxID=50954 RepID=UPI00188FF898|nr:putative oocyte-secreted protein 1 homolog isoform X1 [Talpa occidentalis]
MDVALSSGQMKARLAFGGLFLLSSLVWTCSGEQPVYVRCNPDLLFVRVKPTAFHNDLPVAPDEVFLGDLCPVTRVYIGFYEFQYHPTDCDIRIEGLPGHRMIFLTQIVFMSKLSDLEASLSVACEVPCQLPPVRVIKGNDGNNQSGPSKRPRLANLYIGNTANWRVKTTI